MFELLGNVRATSSFQNQSSRYIPLKISPLSLSLSFSLSLSLSLSPLSFSSYFSGTLSQFPPPKKKSPPLQSFACPILRSKQVEDRFQFLNWMGTLWELFFFNMALFWRASFLTTFYGLYFSFNVTHVTNFHLGI